MNVVIKKPPIDDYAYTEAINSLCTNLSFCADRQKRIMLTSCRSSEGKTSIAMSLMRKLAEIGKKVVLVDADLRRSTIKSRYALRFPDGNRMGLANYLAGMCEVDEIVYSTNIDSACLIPVGGRILSSLALLTDERFSILMDELSERFDNVIIDAPPIGLVIDAAEIARRCTGVLFVVRYNETRRRELQISKRKIERSGCPIIGAVLNDIPFNSLANKRFYGKDYYSQYNEYRDEADDRRNVNKKKRARMPR